MKTRLFQKPNLKGRSSEASEPSKTSLEKREVVREELERQIMEASLKLRLLDDSYARKTEENERQFQENRQQKEGEINNLEAILIAKRKERENLEKPLTEKHFALTEWERNLGRREEALAEKEQALFERERADESRLEGVRDLADELSESRLRLSVREKQMEGRERILKEHEDRHLLGIERFRVEEQEIRRGLKVLSDSVRLREMNAQAKEENLAKREKELLEGHILLNDQRGTLSRAWKELEAKKNGRPKRTQR